jgi:hypothetical protein
LLGIVLCLYLNLIEKCKCILMKPELPVDGNSGHFKYTTYDRNMLELDVRQKDLGCISLAWHVPYKYLCFTKKQRSSGISTMFEAIYRLLCLLRVC